MCGIVGYVGPQDARDVVLEGLRRLEYRGYDSAGIAVVADGRAELGEEGRQAGQPGEGARRAARCPPATIGIGHTRWATHGGPTDRNAHPHLSADGTVAVIHNGIIENFAALRAELRGRRRRVRAPRPTPRSPRTCWPPPTRRRRRATAGWPRRCARSAAGWRAPSRWSPPHAARARTPLVAARRNSPLVSGVGDGEYFLGSDVAAFIAHTREARELGQDQVVEIDRTRGADRHRLRRHRRRAEGLHASTGTPPPPRRAATTGSCSRRSPSSRRRSPTRCSAGSARSGELVLDEVRLSDQELRDIDKIFVVACGTAYHAGLIAKYAIEHWTRIPVEVELASEFRYRDPVLDRSTLVVAISQSGETMDTLMALRHAKDQKARVLAICNANGSTIPRESDAVLYTHAGPEVAVASTKGFLTQLVACYLVGLFLAQVRGIKYEDEVAAIVARPARAARRRRRGARAAWSRCASSPGRWPTPNTILFLGRHVGYPVALEGALKLKELAYIHAEGFAAGELKHGPIALIDQGTPVVVVVPSPRSRESLHGKVVSNIQEVRARGARTIVIAEEGDEDVVPYADHLIRVPRTPTLLAPVVTTVPLQVLACEIADTRGLDVDQPRNLAKSVTVE